MTEIPGVTRRDAFSATKSYSGVLTSMKALNRISRQDQVASSPPQDAQ